MAAGRRALQASADVEGPRHERVGHQGGNGMEHQKDDMATQAEQDVVTSKLPYEKPTLTELSVSATLGGTVAKESETQVLTFDGGTSVRGSDFPS